MLQEISKCQQAGREVNKEKCHEIALRHCIDLAVKVLEEEDITFSGKRQIKQLCLRQKHLHKKGIMFTTFIFSIVIADILGVEFLWSSDSDTLVLPQSIERSVNCVAADPKIGGASTGLIIHNQEETAITRLSSTVYWSELYLTRSSTAVTATSDCQSGPSTLFRVSALPCILVPWYGQSILGKRMVCVHSSVVGIYQTNLTYVDHQRRPPSHNQPSCSRVGSGFQLRCPDSYRYANNLKQMAEAASPLGPSNSRRSHFPPAGLRQAQPSSLLQHGETRSLASHHCHGRCLLHLYRQASHSLLLRRYGFA